MGTPQSGHSKCECAGGWLASSVAAALRASGSCGEEGARVCWWLGCGQKAFCLMKAARWRMAGEGEFEKEWKRLSGFRRERESTVVAAARWEKGFDVEAGAFEGWADLADAPLLWSAALRPRGRLLLRSEPKLRVHVGETAHRRREWARLCRRAGEPVARTPCRST